MSEVKHNGFITQITDNKIQVKIERSSACGGCSSKKICGMGESKEMVIDVPRKKNDNFQLSEKVNVVSKSSLGWKALLYGYILPCLVFIAIITTLLLTNVSDGIAALSALGGLGIYYWGLYLLRDKISKKFVFTIEKCNEIEEQYL